jgi:hypothetical protein
VRQEEADRQRDAEAARKNVRLVHKRARVIAADISAGLEAVERLHSARGAEASSAVDRTAEGSRNAGSTAVHGGPEKPPRLTTMIPDLVYDCIDVDRDGWRGSFDLIR